MVTIDRIAAGGDGVGRLDDGMTVFVPRAAPADRLEIDITTRRKRYARGRILHVVDAAPSRVEAQCNHYDHDECGGCQLQHLDYGAQLEAKRRIVGDALRRIGKLDIADPSIVAAPDPWRYRTKVTLAASESKIGFHQFDRPASVFALERCLIAEENLMDLWQQVRSHRALLPQGLERIVLRSDREGGQHVILEDAREEVWDAAPFVAALGVDHISVWWRPSGGAARIVAGRKTGFPALAFEQGHPALAEALRHRLVEMAGDVTDQVVWDLYAGVGDTAVLLADRRYSHADGRE